MEPIPDYRSCQKIKYLRKVSVAPLLAAD